MENWKKDSRKDIVMVDVDALVPPDHLLRKVERVMDYDWLYERLSPYYCADNGRPGTDPVVLFGSGETNLQVSGVRSHT